MKARDRDADRIIREFRLTSAGIALAETGAGTEAILGGNAAEDGDAADAAGR